MSDTNSSAPRAVDHAYRELGDALLGFLRRLVGDAQAAEDLLHDVMIKAMTAGQDPERAPVNLPAWLYAVARNIAIEYLRKQRPVRPLPDDLAEPAPDDVEATAALAMCLRPLAEQLPAIYGDTLLAAEFAGEPLRAIAEREGVSLSAIKSRVSRGRQLLQAQLVACCAVTLSAKGQVVDYDERAVGRCALGTGCSGAGATGGTPR